MKHIALTLLLFAPSLPARAIDASDFDDVVGYTVVAVTQVRDEFEGCEHDKKIRFDNGWTLTCSEYSYSYAYRPDAVIFAKVFPFKGVNYWMLKALIDDEFYDMEPVRAK
jgi:hypothetical protein